MSLPSQSSRHGAHRSSVFRGQKQSRPLRLAYLLAPLIMLAIWALSPSAKQEPVQAAAQAQSQTHETLEQPPEAESSAAWLDDVELPGSAQAVPEVEPAAPLAQAPASSAPYLKRIESGLAQLEAGDILSARRSLSAALIEGELSSTSAERLRATLSVLGKRWILGAEILAGDPFTSVHTIAAGDLLSRLPGSEKLAIDWRFLQRINGIADPARIRQGQKIKLVSGPFHAVVTKSEYRLDLYLGDGDECIFVAAFDVGHGEFNSTPEGLYQVRQHSKLINPVWINPRTKERVEADDPANPIGEHWIGLEGVSEAVRAVEQIGIHGTTDLASIGQMQSMGCVRMRAEDVALVYEVLVRPASSIEIRP